MGLDHLLKNCELEIQGCLLRTLYPNLGPDFRGDLWS